MTSCFALFSGHQESASDNKIDPSQKAWFEKYKTQANIPELDKTLLNTDDEPDLEDGFVSLFNGKDLEGWTAKGGTCKFEVKDGCIIGTCVPKSNSTYLCTDRNDFKDFVFTCDVKWEVNGNTGVQFRSKTKPGKNDTTVVYGPQAELEEIGKGRGWSGGIYGQSCGGYFYPLWLTAHSEARKAQKSDDWNRITISAQGNVMKTWLNGVPCGHHVDDGSYAQGFFALQVHKGKQGVIRFKNLRVKEF